MPLYKRPGSDVWCIDLRHPRGEELDALLEQLTRKQRTKSTMNSRLDDGAKS